VAASGCLSAAQYLEAVMMSARVLVFDNYPLDPRAARPGAKRTFHTGHRFGFPLDERLDAPVKQIPDPACHPFAHGNVTGEPAKADTLDAAADEESARDDHSALVRTRLARRPVEDTRLEHTAKRPIISSGVLGPQPRSASNDAAR
jgi:hypothetical protein